MNHAISQIRRTRRDLVTFANDCGLIFWIAKMNRLAVFHAAATEKATVCSIMSVFDFDVGALDTPPTKDQPHVH